MSEVVLQKCCKHNAVRLEHFVVIFGGTLGDQDIFYPMNIIQQYNTRTDECQMYFVPGGLSTCPPGTYRSCSVVIGGHIYMYGGNIDTPDHKETTDVWKLTRLVTQAGPSGTEMEYSFSWSSMVDKTFGRLPAPRTGHSGWEMSGCMWVFGGLSESPERWAARGKDYLYEYGKIIPVVEQEGFVLNNQLFCYNPTLGHIGSWTSKECFGSMPCPRQWHDTAKIGNLVWLHGGLCPDDSYSYDTFELDMMDLVWTVLLVDHVVPPITFCHTLAQLSDNLLFLYGNNSAWTFDTITKLWQQLTHKEWSRFADHTATTVGKSVIVIGGFGEECCTDIEIIEG